MGWTLGQSLGSQGRAGQGRAGLNSEPVRAGAGQAWGQKWVCRGTRQWVEGGAGAGMCLGTQRDDRRFSQALPTYPLGIHGPGMPRLPLVSARSPLSPDGGGGGRKSRKEVPGEGRPSPCTAGFAMSLGGHRRFGDREASPLAGELGAGFCC